MTSELYHGGMIPLNEHPPVPSSPICSILCWTLEGQRVTRHGAVFVPSTMDRPAEIARPSVNTMMCRLDVLFASAIGLLGYCIVKPTDKNAAGWAAESRTESRVETK